MARHLEGRLSYGVRCSECDRDTLHVSERSEAEAAAAVHNDAKHDGDDVADVVER